jgi:chitinase
MGTDSASAIVLPGVVDPIVYNVTVDGQSLTINQPCSATGCKDPGNGYVNAGYYAQWAVWGRQYNPYNMPFKNINDVIYAFVGFNPASGDIKTLDASADSWGMSALSRAMLQYPYMKAHLSFGGWTNNGVNTAPMFETLASSQASMDNFATQAISLMRKTGFTGIDIDWEWWSDYPNNLAPAKKMLTFYQTLRTALDKASKEDSKTYTLTIAVNGGSDRVLALQSSSNINAVANFWAQVGALMDHINVMNYDYHGSFDVGQAAYFQANYDFQNVGSNKVGKDEGWSIKSSMDTYIANGVPAKKLVAGIPLYARTMTVASATNGGLFQTVTGAGFGDYENGILDYKCIVNPINNPATGCGSDKPIAGVKSLAYYNSTTNTAVFNLYGLAAMQPWAYSATTNTFMTYDDQFSATQKAKAVKASGLGGTMFWELDGDSTDSNTSIVQAVKNELSK